MQVNSSKDTNLNHVSVFLASFSYPPNLLFPELEFGQRTFTRDEAEHKLPRYSSIEILITLRHFRGKVIDQHHIFHLTHRRY